MGTKDNKEIRDDTCNITAMSTDKQHAEGLEEFLQRTQKAADTEEFHELMRILKDLTPPKEERYIISYSSNT